MTEQEYKQEIARLRSKLKKARKEKKRWKRKYLDAAEKVKVLDSQASYRNSFLV